MLFANAVFNVFEWFEFCLSVLSDVRQIVAVVLFLFSIIRFELCLCRSVWCYAKLRCHFSCFKLCSS